MKKGTDMKKLYSWESVVIECEEILQLNGHARSPLESNLPNIIRDLVYKITVLPIASQQADSPGTQKRCLCPHSMGSERHVLIVK